MIPKILNFEEMVSLYIKILKKTITDTELELFKYNLDISCCVPNAIGTMSRKRTHKIDKF